MAEHHGHAGLVVAESVVVEHVKVGEHEVESVAGTAIDGIVGDVGAVDKLQIDAIAVVASCCSQSAGGRFSNNVWRCP